MNKNTAATENYGQNQSAAKSLGKKRNRKKHILEQICGRAGGRAGGWAGGRAGGRRPWNRPAALEAWLPQSANGRRYLGAVPGPQGCRCLSRCGVNAAARPFLARILTIIGAACDGVDFGAPCASGASLRVGSIHGPPNCGRGWSRGSSQEASVSLDARFLATPSIAHVEPCL